MKKTLIYLLAALLLVFCASGASASMAKAEYEDGNPPCAPQIEVPANPTTGYRWTAVSDDDCVEVFDFGFFPDDNALLGAGGSQVFRLNGAQPGSAEVTLTYGRAWEEAPQHTLIYRVIVEEDLNVMIFEMELR